MAPRHGLALVEIPAALLALVDGWGGIYCMAVREDAHRCGHARAILHALLQVVATNRPARALFEHVGSVTASRCNYRVLPL